MSGPEPLEVPRVLLVTGTDTGVGKTAVTAALAAALVAQGLSVVAYKPVQTGVAPTDEVRPEEGDSAAEEDDAAQVARLGGIPAEAGARLPEPMAPRPAARRAGEALPTLDAHVERVRELAEAHDVVLVEGAGGLFVELTDERETLADLGQALAQAPLEPEGEVTLAVAAVVVCRSALGTLNHTMLTLEALDGRGIPLWGTVIGSWPQEPSAIERDNREELEQWASLRGAVPAGAPALDERTFRDLAHGWFG